MEHKKSYHVLQVERYTTFSDNQIVGIAILNQSEFQFRLVLSFCKDIDWRGGGFDQQFGSAKRNEQQPGVQQHQMSMSEKRYNVRPPSYKLV